MGRIWIDQILICRISINLGGVAGSSDEPITESRDTSFGTLRKHVPIQQRHLGIDTSEYRERLW